MSLLTIWRHFFFQNDPDLVGIEPAAQPDPGRAGHHPVVSDVFPVQLPEPVLPQQPVLHSYRVRTLWGLHRDRRDLYSRIRGKSSYFSNAIITHCNCLCAYSVPLAV